jgi:hypothetical protein
LMCSTYRKGRVGRGETRILIKGREEMGNLGARLRSTVEIVEEASAVGDAMREMETIAEAEIGTTTEEAAETDTEAIGTMTEEVVETGMEAIETIAEVVETGMEAIETITEEEVETGMEAIETIAEEAAIAMKEEVAEMIATKIVNSMKMEEREDAVQVRAERILGIGPSARSYLKEKNAEVVVGFQIAEEVVLKTESQELKENHSDRVVRILEIGLHERVWKKETEAGMN